MFNSEQLKVMCNIIAAVESEGQVYHTQETASGYSDFTEAYTNSSAETSITIGRYQHYGVEALKLLKLIYSIAPDLFSLDLLSDMNNKNWNNYVIKKSSGIAKQIVSIISTQIGKDCQDELVGQQMQEYAKTAESYGVTDIQGQAMCCNFEHQGGLGAVTRILVKTSKPYTLDNLYLACQSDTGNQVGAYKSRQKAVYNMIKQYMPISDTANKGSETMVTADTIIDIMKGWVGLSKSNGSHKVIIDTYNTYLPHPRGWELTYSDDYCAGTVSAAFVKANAVDLLGGIECGVERFIEDCFKPKGIWYEDETKFNPQPGDIITFNWDSNQPTTDNTGFADHIGIVEYYENGYVHTIEGNSGNQGTVSRLTIPLNYGFIRGYARPNYASSSNSTTKTTSTTTTTTSKSKSKYLSNGSVGEEVKDLQTKLTTLGYSLPKYGIDGDFGDETQKALLQFQKEHGLTENGKYDKKTIKQMKNSLANLKAKLPREMFTIKDPWSYIRVGASKNDPILKKLAVGKKVVPLEMTTNKAGNLWIKVNYGLNNGWIVAKALRV